MTEGITIETGCRALFEHVSDGVIIHDPDAGTVRDANGAFEELSGFDRSALIGRDLEELMAEDAGSEVSADDLVTAARRDGADTVECRLRRRDADPFWAELSVSIADLAGETCVLTTVRDVTDRKRRRDELGRFEELVEHVPTGIFRARGDPDGEFLEANPTMVDLFDAESRAEVLATPLEEVYADAEAREEFFTALSERDVVTEKLELRTLSGETFWGLVTVCRFETPDGREYVDGAIKDVTETREYQQVLEERNERLELLNRMVRHDIRNDMQLVQGMADLLDETTEDEDPHLETIRTRVDHVVELTDLMGELMQTLVAEPDDDLGATNLSYVLDRELREVAGSYPDATVHSRGNLPLVEVVANDMLRSVFRNLLNNAVRHSDREEPTVTVSASVEDDGDWVVVRVADDGPGVPDDRKETVFGKGEKGLGSDGTGLGLYLVYTLIDHYGGSVWIEDNDPRGSVFVVRLRLAS